MRWLLLYLGVGALNGTVAGVRQILMISMPKHRGLPEAWVEIAFYILAWPVQLGFWMLVQIHNGTTWLLERIHGAKPDRR